MIKKNTYITYWKYVSLAYPHLLIQWWEDFMAWWELDMIINLSMQDLINWASYSFMAEFEYITKFEEHQKFYNVFYTKHPISKIHFIHFNWEWEDRVSEVVNSMPALNSDEIYFKKWTNEVYIRNDIKSIAISYEKEYEIVDFVNKNNSDKVLPIPFSFVPAWLKLVQDYLAPLNFYQWDSQAGDFYWHYNTRKQELIDTDILTTNQSITLWSNS